VPQALPLGAEGVLDAGVPAALPATLYSRYGNRIVCLLLLVCLALSLMARPRRQPVPARA
jgi:apolipoprotein N-acyltransferase